MLGSLVEKELTTPQQYPLTLNALVLACNQSSNRDPVVDWDESTVHDAVTSAKTKGLARFVHPSHGRSVLRFRHELSERFGLERTALALLAVLMVRGPQTAGELRIRTERMVGFGSVSEVEEELAALARRQEPLVERLGRAPGQKEDRYRHLLGGDRPSSAHQSEPVARPVPDPAPSVGDLYGDLHGELSALRAEVAQLRRDLHELRAQLGA